MCARGWGGSRGQRPAPTSASRDTIPSARSQLRVTFSTAPLCERGGSWFSVFMVRPDAAASWARGEDADDVIVAAWAPAADSRIPLTFS